VADALPDIIAGRLAVVTAAAVGHHFAGRGNRFWRVIHLAGFTPEEILPENDRTIMRHRCGLTATWLLMLLIWTRARG
jgi:double-stranded uracil-DNA glycosylase